MISRQNTARRRTERTSTSSNPGAKQLTISLPAFLFEQCRQLKAIVKSRPRALEKRQIHEQKNRSQKPRSANSQSEHGKAFTFRGITKVAIQRDKFKAGGIAFCCDKRGP